MADTVYRDESRFHSNCKSVMLQQYSQQDSASYDLVKNCNRFFRIESRCFRNVTSRDEISIIYSSCVMKQ